MGLDIKFQGVKGSFTSFMIQGLDIEFRVKGSFTSWDIGLDIEFKRVKVPLLAGIQV